MSKSQPSAGLRWSFAKEQAISSAYYEPLFKMGLHFRTRFWEKSAIPCFGGQSTTDLRIRWVIFPSNDLGSNGSGVLLVYSWMTDATLWNTLTFDQRVDLALHDLAQFFREENEDRNLSEEFIEAFDIYWGSHPSAGGCMYLPGQFTRSSEELARPEGNIHFAGEHLSRHHAWIVGAIDSASTTVKNLLGGHFREAKL